MKLEFSRHSFENPLNMRFHGNPFSGIWVVPLGRTDWQWDMSKLTLLAI